MTSFLDLPYNVRRQVYIRLGLLRVCPINMNTENLDNTDFVQHCLDWVSNWFSFDTSPFDMASYTRCRYQSLIMGNKHLFPNENGFDCICAKLPMSLLLVCRTMYDEVFNILYTENKFRICQTQPRGLTPLLQLSPRAVVHLTTLSIRLNRCCCTRDNSCQLKTTYCDDEHYCISCHSGCRGGQDTPLKLLHEGGNTTQDQNILSSWKQIVHHLAKNIQQETLHLSVICDCADELTAEHIALPLIELPRLAACDIRLGQRPNTVQSDIAMRVALHLVGKSSKQSFPFSKLPIELQMRVLSHTQLVHPNGIVTWRPLTNPASEECCLTCTETLDACCCYIQHGAFSTSDTNCSCWITPTALFLVNHRFYNYCIDIFFSQNTFLLDWYVDGSGQEDGLSQTLLILLSRFPDHIYCHIRKIHIRLYLLYYSDLGPNFNIAESGHSFGVQWPQAIALMATKLILPCLTLLVEDLAERENSTRNLETGFDDSLEVEQQEWSLYQHLVQPIADLGVPLNHFALKLCPPPYGRYHELRTQRRIELEQKVMGQDYISDNVLGLRQRFYKAK